MTSEEFARQYYENIKFSTGAYDLAVRTMAADIDQHFVLREVNNAITLNFTWITDLQGKQNK